MARRGDSLDLTQATVVPNERGGGSHALHAFPGDRLRKDRPTAADPGGPR